MPISRGAVSLSFLGAVGGVAFGGEVQPAQDLEILALKYDPHRPDGQRLRVTVRQNGGDEVVIAAPVADWILVPMARFAEGKQQAAFTLFGKLASVEETQRQRQAGNEILNFHSSLVDTLVGLRLFHVDILILDPGAAELPSDGGHLLLGTGETATSPSANRQALAALHTFMSTLPGNPFQSYVVTDYQQTIRVSVANGALAFEGNPYWHCWKTRTHDQSAIQKVQDAANLWANRIVQRELDHDRRYLSPMELNLAYAEENIHARAADIFDQRTSRVLLVVMPEYSRKLSERIRTLGGINPPVYEATRTAMQFAALFRYVKSRFPESYASFLASLKDVPVAPPVRTPSLFRRTH